MLRSEEMVRELAYALWERAGRPEGEAERLWLEAERSLAVSAAPPRARKAAAPAKPKAPAKAPASRKKVTA